MLKRIIDGFEKWSFRRQSVLIIGTIYSLAGIGFGGIYCGFGEPKKTEPSFDYFYHQPHDTGRSAGVEDTLDAGATYSPDSRVQDSSSVKPDTAPAKHSQGKVDWLRYTVRSGDRFIDLIASEDPSIAERRGKKVFVIDGNRYQLLLDQFKENNGISPDKWKSGLPYSVPDLNGNGKID